jgi:hypothetical protein
MGPHQASTEVVMMPLIWSLGGDLFNSRTKMATFDDPAVRTVIKWMYDCVYVHKVTPAWTLEGQQDETLLRPFLNGQFAMAFGIGNYWLSDCQNAGLISGVYPASANVDDSKLGWFVIPANTGKTYANAWAIAMSSAVTEPDTAWKFITTAASKGIIEEFIGWGGFPGRRSGFDAPAYKADFWQKWLAISDTGISAPYTTNYNNLKDSLTAAMQEIITSGSDQKIEETLKKYMTEYNNRYGGQD